MPNFLAVQADSNDGTTKDVVLNLDYVIRVDVDESSPTQRQAVVVLTELVYHRSPPVPAHHNLIKVTDPKSIERLLYATRGLAGPMIEDTPQPGITVL